MDALRARAGAWKRAASVPSWVSRSTARGRAGAPVPRALSGVRTVTPSERGAEREAGAATSRLRQQLLDAIHADQPSRAVVRDLGLTSNQVWGSARTDQEWSEKLEAALTAARQDDLEHGTNAAYIHGCVCSDVARISRFGWAGTGTSQRPFVLSLRPETPPAFSSRSLGIPGALSQSNPVPERRNRRTGSDFARALVMGE